MSERRAAGAYQNALVVVAVERVGHLHVDLDDIELLGTRRVGAAAAGALVARLAV